MKFFYMDNGRCTACNRCVDSCPTMAIYVADDRRCINYDKCNSCGTCLKNCPVGAITVESIDRVMNERNHGELLKARVQRLENELSSLKDRLSSALEHFYELIHNLPVAAMVINGHKKVEAANEPMREILNIDPLLLSDMKGDLSGESIESVMDEDMRNMVMLCLSEETALEQVSSVWGRRISLCVHPLRGGMAMMVIRDLSDPGVAAQEIVRRLKETIDRKMAMVQQIGFLLGEDVSAVAENLNAIIKIVETSGEKNER